MIDYEKMLSRSARELRPSGIRRFFDIANTMDNVISLGVGEPDFATPWQVRRAAIRSLEQGSTRYTANRGNMELRRAICEYAERKYDLHYDPATEVLVTVGGSEAIDMAMRAIIEPGDEVIIPTPCYVCYEPLTRMAGGVPVTICTRAEDGFKLTPQLLRSAITNRTKLLILPYPSNPTGAVMEHDDLVAIAEVLAETNIAVISDEIYAELTFGGVRHTSIASIDGMRERTIVVNGFSKAFSMTGWRLGYAAAPAEIMTQITKIHQYAIMCAPTTAQHGGIVALRECEEAVEKMREEYDVRRRLIVKGFNDLGLECREPKGAFYAFPCIRSTGLSSDEFCERLLQSNRVALVPGGAFGESGEGFVRASYCYSLAHIQEALRRIGEFLKTLK